MGRCSIGNPGMIINCFLWRGLMSETFEDGIIDSYPDAALEE